MYSPRIVHFCSAICASPDHVIRTEIGCNPIADPVSAAPDCPLRLARRCRAAGPSGRIRRAAVKSFDGQHGPAHGFLPAFWGLAGLRANRKGGLCCALRPDLAQTATADPQCLHLLAAGFRSSDRHAGQVLVGGGSPNTTLPRRAMMNL